MSSLSLAPWSPARPRTRDEMSCYARAHIRRVVQLSKALLAAHPAAFRGVDPALAVRFAALHDRAKTGGQATFLARHQLARPFSEALLRMWGKRAGPQERQVIDDLNRTDAHIGEAFFARHQVPSEVSARYERLVHIADLVDRGMDALSRQREMGRELLPASTVLADAEARRLAQWLEDAYPRVVSASETFAVRCGRLRPPE